jgi:hypothetical protein
VPKDSVIQYETALKTDSFLVMAHGPAAEIARAKTILGTSTLAPRRTQGCQNGGACRRRGPLIHFPIANQRMRNAKGIRRDEIFISRS